MILQKNNKYAKKITAGLGAVIVSLGILTGCNSVNNKVNYIGNIEVCDEQTVNNYLDSIDIKDRYKKIPLNYVGTLVAKDKDGRYCIIQTLEEPDYDNNIVKIYDLFTENYLCQISLEDGDNKIRNKYSRAINLSKNSFSNLCDYFNDKEIIEYGFQDYVVWFNIVHFQELISNSNISYSNFVDDAKKRYDVLYEEDIPYENNFKSVEEIAEFYVTNVPSKFQVTKENSGFTAHYSKEEKFIENYNISNIQKLDRINNLNISNENMEFYLNEVFTLILKDNNGNLLVEQVYGDFDADKVLPLYDLFNNKYLCDLDLSNVSNLNQTNDGLFTGINTKDFINKSSDLENYEIIEFGRWDYPFGFLNNNIEYLRTKDNIDYILPDDMYFDIYKDGVTFDKTYSILELANNYVALVPIDMQMSKELINSNDKKLVKN